MEGTIARHILVIDDDEQMRKLVCRILASEDFDVEVASNAQEGLERAAATPPDLVVSDVRMEGEDGFELLAALRSEPRTAGTPVIMITGLADREGMRRAMELGADDFLAKPFAPEELRRAVASRLRKQSALQSRAESKLAELRQSLGRTLSHELRTPLNAILGYADLLRESSAELAPTEVLQIGSAIHGAGQRLARLVGNYLAYAETELIAGDADRTAHLRRSPGHDLAAIAMDQAMRIAALHGRIVDLSLNGTSAAVPVRVAKEHAAKIVEELVDNAFAFSEPGSGVRISIEAAAPDVMLTVGDRGRGMSDEEVASVGAWVQFERRFYEQQGSGLGLAISRRLAEIYGGTLRIESAKGVGTTVTVALPLETP